MVPQISVSEVMGPSAALVRGVRLVRHRPCLISGAREAAEARQVGVMSWKSSRRTGAEGEAPSFLLR